MDSSKKPLFQQLQDRWPETDSYLERVGQVNNDLQVIREIQAADEHLPGWLERLAIDETDLTQAPPPIPLLKRLWSEGIEVPARMSVPAFRELQREYELDQTGETLFPADSLHVDPNYDLLNNPHLTTAGPTGDEQLFTLPELASKLTSWATLTVHRFFPNAEPPTLEQAYQVSNLFQYLEQEQTGHDWAAASLQSLLSSTFYKQAANPQ